MYTPPTVRGVNGKQGTILMPGWVGGANWGGAAVDPETAYVHTVSHVPCHCPVPPPLPDSSDHLYIRGMPREVPMPGGLPLLKPPYGRITAIDMNTGEHVWMKPNGPGPRDHPAIADMDLPWLGQRGRPAPLLTRPYSSLVKERKTRCRSSQLRAGRLSAHGINRPERSSGRSSFLLVHPVHP